MNVKEYILSGILDDYVVGLLSEEEAREVERLSGIHPEIREEISQIQKALEQYAFDQGQAPPADLEQKVWSTISSGQTDGNDPGDAKIYYLSSDTEPALTKRNWLAAASILLLIGSSVLCFIFYNKWKNAEAELQEVLAQNIKYAETEKVQQAALDETKQLNAFLQKSSTQQITLSGVEAHPESKATVYWNSQTTEVYLALNNLPAAPANKQYQLWAIVDGKPVSAGLVDKKITDATLQKMLTFKNAQAFAITLENEGGSEAPTLSEMYVMGKS